MVIKNKYYKNNSGIGQIFTPSYIAEFMVKNILGFIESGGKKPQNLSILEPSTGEGIFLEFLLKNHLFNITAYEMDSTLKEQLLNSYPNVNFKFENFLGSDPNEKYDLIIGNPPYLGQNYNAQIFQEYIKKFPICAKFFVGNMDLFYFFIHLGISKLNPGGFLSFITTNYWITKSKKTGIKFLKPHLLEECFILQYIDLSHLKIFAGAQGQHNCIFVLQKKTEKEKIHRVDKGIEIIQLKRDKEVSEWNQEKNKNLFYILINKHESNLILSYESALSNNDLKPLENWNLLYPKKIKQIVDKIEKKCIFNSKTQFLKDLFLIRNGIIFINDDIFILEEGKDLIIKDDSFSIKIGDKFIPVNEDEKRRFKKIYKSKSILPYGYQKENYVGHAIYLNKSEFNLADLKERNRLYDEKYPTLTSYIKQFQVKLKNILVNAKENPYDIYFPRRGSFIRILELEKNKSLKDLEPLYEKGQKIFISYITNDNIFGYSKKPYYATSDTYFLWPKLPENQINYPFIIAYLNSKIVRFLFRAKNIVLKRSKTKLEFGLPIPILKNLLPWNEIISEKIIIDKQKDIDRYFFQFFEVNEQIIDNLFKMYYF